MDTSRQVALPHAPADRATEHDLPRAVTAMLRATLLRCADDPGRTGPLLDCAELLHFAGFTAAARTVFTVAFIRMGFSPPCTRVQAEIAGRTRLWGAVQWDKAADTPSPPTGQVVATALGQLRQLMAVAAVQDTSGNGNAATQRHTEARVARPSRGRDGRAEGLAAMLDALHGALRRPMDAENRRVLRALVPQLRAAIPAGPGHAARRHVDVSIPELSLHLAADSMREFLGSVEQLEAEPFGSPDLLHAAAQLGPPGLGPYLADVGNTLRGSQDLLGLVRLASSQDARAPAPHAVMERWVVLLSLHLPGPVLRDLVDHLADLGLMGAIHGILDRVALRTPGSFDAALLWCMRDAGLDNGDLGLALRAQRAVLHHQSTNAVEWIVLGEIEATAGNNAEAEAALVTGLALDATNAAGKQRLRALRDGQFAVLRVRGGFGTPPDRSQLRRLRRQREEAAAAAATPSEQPATPDPTEG